MQEEKDIVQVMQQKGGLWKFNEAMSIEDNVHSFYLKDAAAAWYTTP
jgi:hypothetical protein